MGSQNGQNLVTDWVTGGPGTQRMKGLGWLPQTWLRSHPGNEKQKTKNKTGSEGRMAGLKRAVSEVPMDPGAESSELKIKLNLSYIQKT